MSEEEKQPGTQKTDPVADYLKEKGLYDERYQVTDGIGAAKELFHSKSKIKALSREAAEKERRIKELEASLNAKREKEEDEEQIPEPAVRRVAQETRETQKTLAEIEEELFKLRHSDYDEREEKMQEILDERPEILEIKSPKKRAQTLYDLAGLALGLKPGELVGDKAKAASRAGVPRAAFREPVSPTGSEPPGTGPSTGATFRDEMNVMLQEQKKELAAAKGDIEKQKRIADKYNKKEMVIREKYGELD